MEYIPKRNGDEMLRSPAPHLRWMCQGTHDLPYIALKCERISKFKNRMHMLLGMICLSWLVIPGLKQDAINQKSLQIPLSNGNQVLAAS